MHTNFSRFLALITLVLLSGAAWADQTVTLAASSDTTIYSESDTLSNGAGVNIFSGRTNQSPAASRRALIKFNIAGAVPAGSTITSVQLTLYMSRSKPGADPVAMHRLLADWGEGASDAGSEEGQGAAAQNNDATWRYRFFNSLSPASSPAWVTPGGDFSASASATLTIDREQFYTWNSNPALVSDVQAWVNTPAANFGWVLIGVENATRTATRFDSRTSATASHRPQLAVTFIPPASTGACCLPSGVCQIVTAAQCQSLSGSYRGDGSTCSPNPCPQPTGACCLPSGCQVLTQSQCVSLGGAYQGDGIACTTGLCPLSLTPYVDALPRPAVMQPVSGSAGGAADYVVPIREVTQQLHRDLPPTRVWGYAGSYPGPTIEARRDLPITVTWINDLRDSSGTLRSAHYLPVDLCLRGPDMNGAMPLVVTHLHGGHVPFNSDGYPDFAFPPGQQSTPYAYPNHQPAATVWYHDHGMGITRLNVYMGLAGFYLIRDSAEDALNLPRSEYEIAMAIQDRSFNNDGTLKYHTEWEDHFFGEYMLVNGKVWPYLNVKRGMYRFRLLNGCNSRVLTLGLSNGAAFNQIASDLGLLPAPVPATTLTLSPGERADVVIDFSSIAPGTEIILTNSAPAPFPGSPGVGVIPNVMKFIVQSASGGSGTLPTSLVPFTPISEPSATVSREFILRKVSDPVCGTEKWTINGLDFDQVTEHPRQNTTEIWSWINRSSSLHPMHMHLVAFQVLDRQNFEVINDVIVPIGPRIPAPAGEIGWKDTVQAYPNQITRVITRFTDFTGLYPYHCHMLEHEDHEMMRQFLVVCAADFNADGAIDFFDYLDFVDVLSSQLPQADFNSDGTIDFFDYLDFVDAFSIGC